MSILMSAPILEGHQQLGDSTQAREVIPENSHATARSEYQSVSGSLQACKSKGRGAATILAV